MRHTLAPAIILASVLASFAARADAPNVVCTVRPLSQGSGVVKVCEVKR